MQVIRRSALVAPLIALMALGACSSDDKTLTVGSTSAPTQPSATQLPATTSTSTTSTTEGIVTSSIATDGSTSTSVGDPAATTTPGATTIPAIVSSSVATGSTVASPGPSASTTTVAATPGQAPVTTAVAAAPTGSTTPGEAVTVPDDTTPVATGNPTAFCAFESDIEDATNTSDDATFLAALGTFEPKMTQWEADAPNVQLRAAAAKLHQVTKEAIAANSTSPFDGDALNDAFVPISTFCATLGAPA